MIEELKYGLSRKILIRTGLESANSGSQVRQPYHSATTIKGYKNPTNSLPSGFAKGNPQSVVNKVIRQIRSRIFEAIFLSSVKLSVVRLVGLMMYLLVKLAIYTFTW